MPTVKVEDSGTVDTHPGEDVTLEVQGANATGYLWRLDANPDAVQVIGHQVIPDEESFGGSGVERFVVRPLRSGDSTVRLELKAPWESEPVETHDIHFHSISK